MILSSPPDLFSGPLGRLGLAKISGVAPHTPGLERLGQTPTRESLYQQIQGGSGYMERLSALINLARASHDDPDPDWYIQGFGTGSGKMSGAFPLGLQDPSSHVRTASAIAMGDIAPRVNTWSQVLSLIFLMEKLNSNAEPDSLTRREVIKAIGKNATPGALMATGTANIPLYKLVSAALTTAALTDPDFNNQVRAAEIHGGITWPTGQSWNPPVVTTGKRPPDYPKALMAGGLALILGSLGVLALSKQGTF